MNKYLLYDPTALTLNLTINVFGFAHLKTNA